MKTLKIDPRAQGLIFDLDGTLADTMPYHVEAWLITGRHFNKPITADLINQLNGTPTFQVVEELNRRYQWNLDPGQVRSYKNIQYEILISRVKKIQPILPVFELAKTYRGMMPMSVGTGSTKINALRALHDLGVEDWFDAVVTADDTEKPKPDPDTFLKCAEAMNIPAAQCQVFEDGPMGLQAAHDAGMIVTNVLEFL